MKTTALLDSTRSKLLDCIVKLGIDPSQFPQIIANLDHSIDCCKQIDGEVATELASSDLADKISVVIMGSYGRLEASMLSDVDYLLVASEKLNSGVEAKLREQLKLIVERHQSDKVMLAQDRLFGKVFVVETLLKVIGGFKDVSENLTARMLLLLESVCVYNPKLCESAYRELWEEYTAKAVKKKRPPQLLMNEVLRYYRTLCVDYKYKVDIQMKPWAIRNIKLRHSRKFLCFSTMLSILDSIRDGGCDFDNLFMMLDEPPILKLGQVMVNRGLVGLRDPFFKYDSFLRVISDEALRTDLKDLKYEERETSKTYVTLRQDSYRFQDALIDVVRQLGSGFEDLVYRYFLF